MNKTDTLNNTNTLDQVLSGAKKSLAQGITPKFVFDLDSTLFCVSPRTEFILKQYSQTPQVLNKHPEAAKKMQSIEALPVDWGIKTILNRHDVKESLAFFEATREYWIQHFFSSHHLDKDIPYKGAVEFVKYVHQLGIEVQYLTGRDQVRMKTGTLKSLSQHGLPLVDSAHLNMKPDTSFEDTEYKLSVFQSWNDVDLSHVWFFENEPYIINRVKKQFPKIHLIYMDSVHSGRESAHKDIPKIHFEWNFQKS